MTYHDALANAKALKTAYPKGRCLEAVRTAFVLAANGHEPTAQAAWIREGGAAGVNTHTATWPAPANVPVFWSGGSAGDGHIAISDGHGNVLSTDVKRVGLFDLVPIGWVAEHWGLRLEGWSEVLEGVRVHDPVHHS